MKAELKAGLQERVGTLVAGKYLLTGVLGAGGMGAVYAATHEFTGRRVAVKLLHGDFAVVPAMAQRFLQEARATSTLQHPSIIEVLDAGQNQDGSLYLALELLEGQTLESALQAKLITVDDFISIFAFLLDALGAAHEGGLVHRDMKPANVFLCRGSPFPERVKILDFGVARRITGRVGDGLTEMGTILGTPRYMSPEVFMGEPLDARTDLWAIGVMMFQGLSGVWPYESANLQGMLRAMQPANRRRLREVRPELPEALSAVVERCLELDPGRRWQSAAEIARALRGFSAKVPPPAASPTPPARAGHTRVDRPKETSKRVSAMSRAPEPPSPPAAAPRKRHAWEDALGEIDRETTKLREHSGGSNSLVREARSWVPRWLKRD